MKTITIDNNKSVLDLMKYIMKKNDPEGSHFFADTAEQGLSVIEKENIRIIFLDIEMPGISGLKAAKYLIDRYQRIDLIFITGHSEYALVGHKLHCSGSFGIFVEETPFCFDRKLTSELFAYLIYKNGAFVTNGELIAVFWQGNADKKSLLRKYIKDMRDCFARIGAENVLIKIKGSIGVNMSEIELDGDPECLSEQFGWLS